MTLMPKNRPAITRERVEKILHENMVNVLQPVVLTMRGYFQDSMGVKGKNDRGIYDDAIVIISPNQFRTFNANADPSVYRKAIATLAPGVYKSKPGIHGLSKPKSQQYQAFVQASPVKVYRDQSKTETGWFGINIHRGSKNTTSSLGCITVPPNQWDEFRDLLNGLLKMHNVPEFTHCLVEMQG